MASPSDPRERQLWGPRRVFPSPSAASSWPPAVQRRFPLPSRRSVCADNGCGAGILGVGSWFGAGWFRDAVAEGAARRLPREPARPVSEGAEAAPAGTTSPVMLRGSRVPTMPRAQGRLQ